MTTNQDTTRIIRPCEICGAESELPMTQWLRERGYPANALGGIGPQNEEARQRWHFDTGTGTDRNDWFADAPTEWGEWDGWRSKNRCENCAIAPPSA